MAARQIIVVGGGLSGLSAAHTVLEHGGNVLVLDKNSFLGGNSTKATSGINGALTRTQIRLGIPDSVEKFYEDTAHSARDLIRPALVQVLTGNSASAVEWLQAKFQLDLSLVSRLGGHSFPRTHRGKERFPGMTITYALMEKLEDIAKADPGKARVIVKARVTKLIKDSDGTVLGVQYEKDGQTHDEYGPVVLATGGYAADFSDTSLLRKHRPDIYDLPTTNGDYSTGDGIKMCLDIGANTVDLEKVQVHPTGLVDPKEPDAKVKFLAAEALRGVGGILLDNEGHRFCDELGHRDYVTGEMWKLNKAPYRLVLNTAASKEIEWHCKHYMGRGLMEKFESGKQLADAMGISVRTLEETFNQYNGFAEKKTDPFGKKFYANVPLSVNDGFYVAVVTPVLHFCMGGVEINDQSEVLGPKGPVAGLFGAGEVAGGIHGANRLGGSSLLACVVFGRVAGATAARYHMGELIKSGGSQAAVRRAAALGQQLQPGDFTISFPQASGTTRVDVEPQLGRLSITWGGQEGSSSACPVSGPASGGASSSSSSSSGSPAPQTGAPPPNTPAGGGQNDPNKEWTAEEVAKHNTEQDCWVIVNGQVLDVTSFLGEHPGGKKAILIYAGRDATEEFNMLHKPDVVEKYAPQCVIGKLKAGSSAAAPAHGSSSSSGVSPSPTSASRGGLAVQGSETESRTSGGTAGILPAERAKATFDVKNLTDFLNGGPEGTKRRKFILSVTEGDDTFEKINMSRPEQLKQHIRHFIKVHEDFWDTFKPTRQDYVWMMENSMASGALMNHYGLFLQTIELHGTPEQLEWWGVRARRMQIVGCYAQTELGHGSNVRGLMATAEYDKSTQEFVLDTPTLRSIKWWPGALGKVATHAVVYAQLLIDGKEHGVHAFILQIRDENHRPLPGIELGDLGPKLGDHANDTGYMVLNRVRVPREYMLARFQEVTPSGEYVKSEQSKKNAKLHYATMMFTRGSMVSASGGFLARAVTCATRYSCVRSQGFTDPKKAQSYLSEERQIIDHQVQRYRIFRQIAFAYAIKFTGAWMSDVFSQLEEGGKSLTKLENLSEIAATSSGLKALCTFLAWQGIEDCRKCCGGNGYLLASGVAPLAADYVWQSTAEGDWIILMLQTAQFLLKSLQNVMTSGKPIGEIVAYLAPLRDSSFDLKRAAPPAAKSPAAFFDLEYLLALFRYCALSVVVNVGKDFQQSLSQNGGRFADALNSCALELTNAVRAHTGAFMLRNFTLAVAKVADPAVKAALSRVCALYACSSILDDPQWAGLLNRPQVYFVKAAVVQLMQQMRPDAVALVDAFDIPDRVLNSAVGRYDGNVYEALYEAAQKSVLNRTDPFDGFEEVLQPYLDRKFLELHNKNPKKSSSAL